MLIQYQKMELILVKMRSFIFETLIDSQFNF